MRARSVICAASIAALSLAALEAPVAGASGSNCGQAAIARPGGLTASYANSPAGTFRISFSLRAVPGKCARAGVRQVSVYQEASTGGSFHRNSTIAILRTNAARQIRKTFTAPFDCTSVANATARAVVQLAWTPKGHGSRSSKMFRTKAQQVCPPPTTSCATVAAPAPRPNGGYMAPTTQLDPAKTWTATVVTSCGTFAFRLDVQQSPNATASIASLAGQNFFDNTIFHRIATDFLIQGGDPTATGSGGPGYSTVDTPPSNASYTKGVVAMAKTDQEAPGTAGSQFFVITTDDAGLSPDYAIVGRVSSGMDVVARIGKLGDRSEQPTRTVVVTSVRVTSS